uniref:Uncharacterized protein n=1 Tax=Geobacter sp. (strain M21) TaxID=443144 RepID=C6E6P9_GEOSM
MEINGLNLEITIGDLEVFRAPRWWIESLRHHPLGRAGITLPDPKGELYQTVQVGDEVTISVGYRDQSPATWSGTVAGRYPGETRDQLEIRAVDGALPLAKTKITQAWENETPEALVAWVIRQTGLSVGTIMETGMVLPRVSAGNIPAWQLIQQIKISCRDAFGLDMSKWALWLGAAGVNWGDLDEPGDTVAIATLANLIEHEPIDWRSGMGLIETHLIGDLSHSRLIRLQDVRRGIDEVHRALRVRHEGTPDKVRTLVWYGVENG